MTLLHVGGLFALHTNTTDAGSLGGGHVVAVLPADFFLNELSLLAVADVVYLFRAVPGSPLNFNKIYSCVAHNRLSFSACLSVFDLFWLDLPIFCGQNVGQIR